ncbi:hypothetical protein AAIH46_14820 [Rhizobium sp. 0TCS1.26]|uniref:hypothetical protein n=1 Tax=Rhizobium sp. 0TCS1.26 TaxID=3142623 RepID=UPI003D2D58A5
MTGSRARLGQRAVIVCIGLCLAALLALPGATVTTKYVNDLFIFLDGAHRIWSGQVPNVDFLTSLGPLAFYIPAAGYGLTGSMGAAMPVGMALVVLLLAVVAGEVIASRMGWIVGLPLALFLLLIAAVPANPGEWIGELSFAMFYNRMGWAALGLMLVFYLPRRSDPSRGKDIRDAACATILVLLMLYTKITYALVEIAFLVFLLSDHHQRRWVALALATIAICALCVEFFWRGSLSHLADLRLAGEVSGGLPSVEVLANVALKNLADIAVFGLFSVLFITATRRIRDLLFAGFCAATGLLIIEQNFQIVGILTLGAGAAVITETLLRQRHSSAVQPLGLPLLLIPLLLPPSASHATTLSMHAFLAVSGKGEAVPLPQFSAIRLVPMWSEGQFGYFRRYNETLADGKAALAALGPDVGHVAVLDFVNPFSAGLNLAPPRGDSPWYHWGRTLNPEHHPDAEVIFAAVELILDPKVPIEPWTTGGMREIYQGYIDSHYRLETETADWRIYRRLP